MIFIVPFLSFLFYNIHIGQLTRIENLKLYGLLLETYGTLLVIVSFAEKLKTFKDGDYFFHVKKIFKDFPYWKKKIRNIEIKAGTGMLKLTGFPARIVIKPAEEDVAGNLKALWKQIDEVYEVLNAVKVENKKEIDNLQNLLSDHKKQMEKRESELTALIADAAKPNIWKDTFGVWCIVVGMILSNLPELISKY